MESLKLRERRCLLLILASAGCFFNVVQWAPSPIEGGNTGAPPITSEHKESTFGAIVRLEKSVAAFPCHRTYPAAVAVDRMMPRVSFPRAIKASSNEPQGQATLAPRLGQVPL